MKKDRTRHLLLMSCQQRRASNPVAIRSKAQRLAAELSVSSKSYKHNLASKCIKNLIVRRHFTSVSGCRKLESVKFPGYN